MHIAYVIGYIHGWGGIERVISVKANYLVSQGHTVSIVKIYSNHDKPYFDFDPAIRFYSLDFDQQKGIKKKLDFYKNKKKFIIKINQLFHKIKPDISISTFCKYSRYLHHCDDNSKKIIERHFAKYKRNQFFVKTDRLPGGRFLSYLYKIRDYRVVRHFDKFVVLTREDKADWGPLKNIVSIPNPLTFVAQHQSDCQAKRAIAMGRISKQKQFDVMLNIWQQIIKKHPDWQLVIFANGGQIGELIRLSKRLGIENHFQVHSTTREVEREMCSSSIYLMTSKYEGFGLVLTEAMNCGLPVISFGCKCGPKDIITHGKDGFLIEPGKNDDFVEKLDLLIRNEDLRKEMGHNASLSVRRFEKEKVMNQWLDLFEELIPS